MINQLKFTGVLGVFRAPNAAEIPVVQAIPGHRSSRCLGSGGCQLSATWQQRTWVGASNRLVEGHGRTRRVNKSLKSAVQWSIFWAWWTFFVSLSEHVYSFQFHPLIMFPLFSLSGWWFETFFIFPYIGNVRLSSSQLTHIFQRGGPGPPTSYHLMAIKRAIERLTRLSSASACAPQVDLWWRRLRRWRPGLGLKKNGAGFPMDLLAMLIRNRIMNYFGITIYYNYDHYEPVLVDDHNVNGEQMLVLTSQWELEHHNHWKFITGFLLSKDFSDKLHAWSMVKSWIMIVSYESS